MTNGQFSIVITTCSGTDNAEKIIQALLSEKLAACIQVYEIKSFYSWKGNINEDAEQMLLVKAKALNYDAIEKVIIDNHSYEIPEIIQVPITNGSDAYLNWIKEVSI